MELEELKQNWNNSGIDQTGDINIIQMIQHDSNGPVAQLKRAFRKQYLFIIIFACFILLQLTRGFTSINIIMFSFYTLFCILLALFFYSNYRIVRRIENMDNVLKVTIQQQIDVLERRLKFHIIAVRIALLFFIALTEILPYFQHNRMMDKWHAAPLVLRLAAYIGLIGLQYFVSRRLSQRKFGRYLAHLKELVIQMK